MSTSSNTAPLAATPRPERPVRRACRRARGMTPLGAVARGLVAGAAGTFAMDALLYARYRRGRGEERFEPWEFSSGLESWEHAPAPAQVGKRLVEGLFERELPPERARLVNNITHWAFGIFGGVQYGIVAGSLPTPAHPVRTAVRRRRVGGGIRRTAGRQAVRADLEVRPGHVDQGSERPPGLRAGHRDRAAPARGQHRRRRHDRHPDITRGGARHRSPGERSRHADALLPMSWWRP